MLEEDYSGPKGAVKAPRNTTIIQVKNNKLVKEKVSDSKKSMPRPC